MIIISIINSMIYIGMMLGYILGLKLWDLYYDKVIVPKKEELEKQRRLKFFEVCKIIGNPKTSLQLCNIVQR